MFAGRQLLPGLLDALADHLGLLFDVAAQHDAVVDDGRDTIEQYAIGTEFLRLAVSRTDDGDSQGCCAEKTL